MQVNSGGTLSLAGGASFNGNLILAGSGTVDFNAGTFAGGNFALWAQTPITQEAATMLRALATVGTGLGMTVVAQGVETAAQARMVQADGCSEIQGYLISEPVPAPDVAGLLARELTEVPAN